MQELDLGPAGFALVQFFGFLAGCADEGDFGAYLVDGCAFVQFEEDGFGFLQAAAVDELAWGFGAEGEEAGEDDGWDGAWGRLSVVVE